MKMLQLRAVNRSLMIAVMAICLHAMCDTVALAQSPEILLREFASGQIKKGVRSIGMGGDGATWGNYSLVWRDSATAIADAGATGYGNGNNFSFTAVGVTTPVLWHGMVVYLIALSQHAHDEIVSLRPGGSYLAPVPMRGDGCNQGVFAKVAMPLGKGWSAGILISYERSQFTAVYNTLFPQIVRYETKWLPSGGFGISWQPVQQILFGVRALFNHDVEQKSDNLGLHEGLNLVHEYRAGASLSLWKDGLIDVGGNLRYRYNKITNTSATVSEPNLGIEQNFLHRRLALRAGLDETSPTAGLSVRRKYTSVDIAYIYDMAQARLSDFYGRHSNSVIMTLTFDYGKFYRHRG